MKRRNLLAISSAGLLMGINGCADYLEEPETIGQDNDGDPQNEDSNGGDNGTEGENEDSNNDVLAMQNEYEDDADPLTYETLQLGDCMGPSVVPTGVCSDNPTHLNWVAGTDYFEDSIEDDSPWIYSFSLGSEEDANQIDETALNNIEIRGGSESDAYDQPIAFIEDTNFETDYLLLIQSDLPSRPAELAIDSVGELSQDKTYVGIHTSAGDLEAVEHLSTLVRVEGSKVSDSLLIGETFNLREGDRIAHAIYRNDEK